MTIKEILWYLRGRAIYWFEEANARIHDFFLPEEKEEFQGDVIAVPQDFKQSDEPAKHEKPLPISKLSESRVGWTP